MNGFRWHDGERLIVYGGDLAGRAGALLSEQGWDEFHVLTSGRADPGLGPSLVVGPGQVPELAAGLLERAHLPRLVAWGGGRVIDVAKAIVSARGGQVCAVPTTLSGAEMTHTHRRIPGFEERPPVRPVMVVADPALMTALPEEQLRASAMNALAHGAEALVTPRANPVATMAALRGAALLAGGERALGSLLCAYAMDSAGYALHHVVCQSVVRMCGTAHAETNAAVLPHSLAALAGRTPEAITPLAEALGSDLDHISERILELSGGPVVPVDAQCIDAAASAALLRPELSATPGPPPTRDELAAILRRSLATG